MNKQTLSLIQERFKNLTDAGAELIRAEQRHGEASVGVFYFDFSQAPAQDGFNLTDYLQKNLASDFYKHEGSLQWNYYLYFVLEKNLLKQLRQDGKLAGIEADRTFARKFVTDEAWLEKELQNPFALTVYGSSPPKDLAAAWTEKLTQAGYGRICDADAVYTEIVKDILLGKPSPVSKQSAATRTSNDVQPGKSIEQITIERFREYPTQKTFDLGAVNLIRGTNGSGKTSLLEAIELSICGGIRRQGNSFPRGTSLLVKFQGENAPSKVPVANLAMYQAIDRAWYGGYYRKVNKLCENFGRFNFFDSDAGFRLSDGKSPGQINKAIEDLFLGEYASTLEKMMLSCKERLEKEQTDSAREMRMRRTEAGSIEANLQTVKNIKDTRETLLEQVKAKATSNGWKKIPSRFNLDALVAMQETVDDLSSQFGDSFRELRWLSVLSLKSLEQEFEKLKSLLKDLQEKADTSEKTSEAFDKAKDKKNSAEAQLQLLNKLLAYHDEPGAFLLKGSEAALKTRKAKLEQLKAAQALVKRIDTKPFEETSATFDVLDKEHEGELAKQRKLVSQKRKKITELQTQFGEIKALVEEIKGLGEHLCELKPDTKECPLCGAPYEQGLLGRIASRKTGAVMDASLREMTTAFAHDEKQLAALQKQTHELGQLREAASLVLQPNELRLRPLKFFVQTFSTIGEQIDSERTAIDELSAKQKRLKLRGHTEGELNDLLSEAVDIYQLPVSKLSNPGALRTLISSQRSQCEALTKEMVSIEKQIKDVDVETRRLIKKALGVDDFDEPVVELHRRKTSIEEALAMIRRSETNVSIADTEEFSVIRSRLTNFSEAIARIQEALKKVEEKDELEKKWVTSLESIRKQIAQLETKCSRAKKAVDVLGGLLEGESKEAYLKEMVNQQREKLVTIFRRIHAPNEFENVRLNGEIYVKRRTGNEDDLSKISTGQRSALALSIFLTMNSSVGKNAPWLIFDDPVAQVDDLNTLSFFDTLRELVLEGKRQVFIATANTRVANLFARKFDFLGKSFKEISLGRADR